MVGHLAENGLVVYEEFRQGNVTPSAKNLEFIKQCEKQMANGKGQKDRIFKGRCGIVSGRDI